MLDKKSEVLHLWERLHHTPSTNVILRFLSKNVVVRVTVTLAGRGGEAKPHRNSENFVFTTRRMFLMLMYKSIFSYIHRAALSYIEAGQLCASCSGVELPEDCQHHIECRNNEQHYVHQYTTESGLDLADLGCRTSQACPHPLPSFGKRDESVFGARDESVFSKRD